MVCQDVFHIRLHNMEIQAERIIDPRLKTQAVAIISSNHSNGSIISLSSEAKEEGTSSPEELGLQKASIPDGNRCDGSSSSSPRHRAIQKLYLCS